MTSLKHFLCVYLLVGFSCLINAQSLPAYRVPLSDNGAIWVVKDIALGGAVMGPQIARKVMEFFGQGKFHMQDVQSLSDQEKAVAQWVVLGRTTQEIVAEMKISPGLVKFHLRNMYQKLQVHNRQSFIKKFKK